MSYFKDILLQFDFVLRKYNLTNYLKLQEPLSDIEKAYYFETMNISEENLRDIYSWKNGFDYSNGISGIDQIMHFGILFPLESVYESLESSNDFKSKELIPFAGEEDGTGLLFLKQKGF